MYVLDCDLLTPVLVSVFCLPAQLQPRMQLGMTSFIQSMLTTCIAGIKNKSNTMAKKTEYKDNPYKLNTAFMSTVSSSLIIF